MSGFPRAAGKSLLRAMPGPGTTIRHEHQSLATTIAIMIGADSGFRKIMEAAMGEFYAVSMEDVAWCGCFPAFCMRHRDDFAASAACCRLMLPCAAAENAGKSLRRTTPTLTVSRKPGRFPLRR